MDYCAGIDLGSTTTKAVILSLQGEVLGKGITNSRSNYEVACKVALGEALSNTRFFLIQEELKKPGASQVQEENFLKDLEEKFREQQYLGQLKILAKELNKYLAQGNYEVQTHRSIEKILQAMEGETARLFSCETTRKSDFFRDLAGSRFVFFATGEAKRCSDGFDVLISLYDKAILDAENTEPDSQGFQNYMLNALQAMEVAAEGLKNSVFRAAELELTRIATVGTGYGRQTLPFPKEQIRSEILCHGLGAHSMFPNTRTVLDIGGQDTKAIQVDSQGIVTSFQMNDRCAAGCGRYLGYIADEMNLGLHELGPLAEQSTRNIKINSTCTVFAGAELRERLSLGEKREDILAGLHRAIILRAMSLLARSGGVEDEFSFTGGVAKNPAAVRALRQLIEENYGERKINISPNSIYTGALGAALFAVRDVQECLSE